MTSSDPKHPVDVAVIASPGIGHIIPLLEFSKWLCVDHGLRVGFLVINTMDRLPAQDHLLRPAALPPNLRVVDLPPVDVSVAESEDHGLIVQISIIVERSLGSLREVLIEAMGRPKAVVIDIFCTKAFEVCREISIPTYSFFTSSAALLAFCLYLPKLDRDVEGEFVDMPGPVKVPGCISFSPDDLLDQVKNRKSEEYRLFLLHVSRLPQAAGIFVNTWDGLESVSLAALRGNPCFLGISGGLPPVYAIGPVTKQAEPAEALGPSGAESLAWLDRQPAGSVVFLSFGSGGTMTIEQLTELAWGLQLSRHRFLWVVRAPTGVSRFGTFFKVGSSESIPAEEYLPEGFLDRTRGMGHVVQSWAPQTAILSHAATGTFMSHCGWNSTLESLSCGVPMIAWPMYAEQRMNAVILAEEFKVGVRPAVMDRRTGLVGREEVARVVRMVMEGEEGKALRRKARELKDDATVAMGRGGASREALATVCWEWRSE